MDGRNIQDEFFDGRIAAEMRLWEALENDLLSPFHYFGISDNTDLSTVEWKRGAYDPGSLSNQLSSDVRRAKLVVKAVREKIVEPGAMRALASACRCRTRTSWRKLPYRRPQRRRPVR